MYTKEQIKNAFKEWEVRFRNTPESFEPTKDSDDLDEVADIKVNYLIELIEENDSVLVE